MSSFLEHESATAGEPAELQCVGSFASRRAAAEHGLVVLAMGLPYWLDEAPGVSRVFVEAQHVEDVRREFALFEQANVNWPPVPLRLPDSRAPLPWFTPMLWAISVVWAFQWQMQHAGPAVATGALDGRLIFEAGEWWRVFTALFLHADGGHLMANLVIGVFVFTQLMIARGVLRGWIELVISTALAQLATATVHAQSGVVALGASTAVFAGIGLLTGSAVRAGARGGRWWRREVLVPLSAGVVLLGWLGAGDAQTDVLAHGFGFLCGAGAGVVAPVPRFRANATATAKQMATTRGVADEP